MQGITLRMLNRTSPEGQVRQLRSGGTLDTAQRATERLMRFIPDRSGRISPKIRDAYHCVRALVCVNNDAGGTQDHEVLQSVPMRTETRAKGPPCCPRRRVYSEEGARCTPLEQ